MVCFDFVFYATLFLYIFPHLTAGCCNLFGQLLSQILNISGFFHPVQKTRKQGSFSKKKKYTYVFVQNMALLSLLAVVRGHSSPEEQCVLSTTRVITQLWIRMSPEQVRSKCTRTHTVVSIHDYYPCKPSYSPSIHTGADPPCASVYSAAAPVSISHFSEKH